MVGSRLGQYEVLSAIGRGGMGEVWRARDTKLGREVAIKTLPVEFSRDPDRLARFEREARLLASLNHPNIGTIHGLEEDGQTRFLVLELIEGPTLADRIRQGAIPVEESLDLALQIAEALEAAHEKGVIHRDLKPANIKLTGDGRIKVLDFGLAKALAPDGAERNLSDSPTISQAATRQGVILGTPAYMSPEQARGQDADRRADIWAFGCLLYEMLTGRPAFAGRDTTEVLVEVMRDEPGWDALESAGAGPVEALLRRCLRKDRARRYQHIGDVRVDLEDARAAPPRPADEGPAPVSRVTFPALLGGLAAGLVLAGLLTPIAVSLGWVRWGVDTGGDGSAIRQRQITSQPAELAVWGGAVSPDGTYVAYSDPTGLYLEIVETGEANLIPVSGDLDFSELTWTPDGTRVIATGWSSLTATTAIYSIPVIGGRPQRLADGWRAAVSPGGDRIAWLDPVWPTRAIRVMDIDGGNSRVAVTAAEGEQFFQVAWSPDGERLAIGTLGLGPGFGPSIQSVRVDGDGERTTLVADPRLFMNWRGTLPLAWLPGGRLIYTMQEATPNEGSANLWIVDADPARGVRTAPARLTDTLGSSVRDIRTTADGRALTLLRERNQSDVYVAPLADDGRTFAGEPERLTLDERDDTPSDWMPDGRGVLFESNRGNNGLDIYRQDIGSRVAELLVGDPAPLQWPRVTPDGAGILFALWGPEFRQFRGILHAPLRGSAEGPSRTVLETGAIQKFDCGRARCVVSRLEGPEAVFSELDPETGPGAELARTAVDFADANFVNWALSPDGRRIVVTNFGTSLRVLDLDPGAERVYETPGWTALEKVTWTAGGTGVLVAAIAGNGPRSNNQALLHVDVDGAGETTVVRHVANEWHTFPRISPDGTHLAFALMKLESNVWMLEGF